MRDEGRALEVESRRFAVPESNRRGSLARHDTLIGDGRPGASPFRASALGLETIPWVSDRNWLRPFAFGNGGG